MAVFYRDMNPDENVRSGDEFSRDGEHWMGSVNYLVCKKQSPGYMYRRPIQEESCKSASNRATDAIAILPQSDYAAAQRVWDEWRVSKDADLGIGFVTYFQQRQPKTDA